MNYAEQQIYLRQSRIWAIVSVLVWIAVSAVSLAAVRVPARSAIAFGCIVAAIAVSLLYTPDYLHLTVNRRKRVRWGIMVRWRIIAGALVAGLLLSFVIRPAGNVKNIAALLIAIAWLTSITFLARKWFLSSYIAGYFWLTDFVLLAALLLLGFLDPLLGAALIAAAAHLDLATCEGRPFARAAAVIAWAWLLLLGAGLRFGFSENIFFGGAMVLVSAGATAWLVHRAQEQNSQNTQAALQELMEFTGYPAPRIWRMWWESDKELARNWVAAALDEGDSAALTEWYRQNSELYMFAISGYNLDYKRIRSNLKVLRFAQGACLDYGAGNGEIILELARRGHPATYYDVDGVSAKFAKHRAERRGLDVRFVHAKDGLKAAALPIRFDTVFSLDVLEHLPDLPGELTFLASLLNPGGRFVFDVPAGTTKSHPMHLNHNVEVSSLLQAKGLRQQRTLWQKLPFMKQEKYVFIAA